MSKINKIVMWCGFMAMVLVLVGCVMSQDQMETIATTAGDAAAAAVRVAVPAAGVTPEGAAGIAGAVGLAVAAFMRWILPKMSKPN